MIKLLASKNQALLEKIKIRSSLKTMLASLDENSVHKRLRDEILMLPIPKAKLNDSDAITKFFSDTYREEILDKQRHHLKSAVERVSKKIFFWSRNSPAGPYSIV